MLFTLLFVFISSSLAGYTCITPTDCNITCDNFVPKGYHFPNVFLTVQSPWIVVPTDNGSCYFYNSVTDENQDELPVQKNTRLRSNKHTQYIKVN